MLSEESKIQMGNIKKDKATQRLSWFNFLQQNCSVSQQNIVKGKMKGRD